MALISIFRRPILSVACYGRMERREGARGGRGCVAMRKRQSARRAGAPWGDGDVVVAVAVAVGGRVEVEEDDTRGGSRQA